MCLDDHLHPHFRVFSGGQVAAIALDALEVLEGQLPRRALALVLEWAS